MDPKYLDLILANTENRQHLVRRARIIKDFINFKFYTNQTPDTLATIIKQFKDEYIKTGERSGIETDFKFLENLPAEFFESFTVATLKDQLAQLDGIVDKADIITIYIPFQSDDQTTSSISQWIKQNVSPQSLIDIQYDNSLIGGCALSHKGVYRDFSLKQKVQDHQRQILDLLLSYKRQKQASTG